MTNQSDLGLIILLVLPFVAFLVPLVWWGLLRRPERESALTGHEDVSETVASRAEPAKEAELAMEDLPYERDNLMLIEGIGPKISSVLKEAGIATFTRLAEAETDELEQIVRDAGIRLAFPETWSEQARLAAAGQWDALEALQAALKGGRRE